LKNIKVKTQKLLRKKKPSSVKRCPLITPNYKGAVPLYNPPKSKRKEQRLKKQINKNYWWENIHQYAGEKGSLQRKIKKT